MMWIKFIRIIKNKKYPIEIEMRNEVWGDRHFAIMDPNGIGIDIVKYTPPQKNKNTRPFFGCSSIFIYRNL